MPTAPSFPDAQIFEVHGCSAFVIPPDQTDAGRQVPWVWYAPTLLPDLPDALMQWLFAAFHSRGMAVAGVDVGESYGSPNGRAVYTALYHHLVDARGYAERPALLPRSRGGLMLYNWAVEHPQAAACIGGIYPVCDLRSYPGLEKACGAYGMTRDELDADLPRHNPVDRIGPLAAAKVPVLHIHGDQDHLVPLEANSGALIRRYRALGGPGELVVAHGEGHNGADGFFKAQELVDFIGQM